MASAVPDTPDIGRDSPKNQTSKSTIKYVPSAFTFHSFHSEVNETTVSFHLIKMDCSIFLWIGKALEPTFNDLSVAMSSLYEKSPLGTKVMGPALEMSSINIAIRLSKKLNKQVFVSCNLTLDRFSLPSLEKCIYEEMKRNPTLF